VRFMRTVRHERLSKKKGANQKSQVEKHNLSDALLKLPVYVRISVFSDRPSAAIVTIGVDFEYDLRIPRRLRWNG
jgi:hypothetical protein